MSDYGNQTLGTIGSSLQLIASDFEDVLWKPGGITIDWATVTAVVSDTLLPGGTTILAGQKYIPLGTILCKITASGKYGPANTNVGTTDGRQLLARGDCYLLNEDISQNAPYGIIQGNASDHPGVFNEGTIWKSRLHVGGTDEPTLANFVVAFPGINFASM